MFQLPPQGPAVTSHMSPAGGYPWRETFTDQNQGGSESPGLWHAARGGSQPVTAAHAWRHFQVILIREAVT